jgi:hypothetical protein
MAESTIKFETRNPKLENRRRSGRMAGGIRDFKDLDVWVVARDLRTEMYKVARALPDFEKIDMKEGERLDAVAQRVAQLLNGYLRSTLALKAVAAG